MHGIKMATGSTAQCYPRRTLVIFLLFASLALLLAADATNQQLESEGRHQRPADSDVTRVLQRLGDAMAESEYEEEGPRTFRPSVEEAEDTEDEEEGGEEGPGEEESLGLGAIQEGKRFGPAAGRSQKVVRFRGDLGKRGWSSFRGDLGKRGRSSFRGDLGKRRMSSFRGDLGKRSLESSELTDLY